MIYFFLILIVLGISFFVVRIGGIAFELTGMGTKQANFQSLSCFTGTGFTTRESELVVNHPLRRRIASMLMVAGNIVFVTMIGSFVNTLAASREIQEHTKISFLRNEIRIHNSLFLLSEFVLVIIVFWALYLFFTRSSLWFKLKKKIKERMAEMSSFAQVDFEEFLIGASDCGTVRMKIEEKSFFCGKTLREANFRSDFGAQVLAIERKGNVIYNPSASDRIECGDFLIIFGKISEITQKLKKIE